MIDYYNVVAVMMINQYRVSGDVNVPMRTQIICRNIVTEQMVEMRKNDEDTADMMKVWDKLTYRFVWQTIYGFNDTIEGLGQVMDR